MKLEFHCLNKNGPALLSRPTDQEVETMRLAVDIFMSGKAQGGSRYLLPVLNRYEIGFNMKVGEEGAIFGLHHLKHRSCYALAAVSWGGARSATSAFNFIFNQYLGAVLNDVDGTLIPEVTAPTFPEVVPNVTAAYFSPYYKLMNMHPMFASDIERVISRIAFAALDIASSRNKT